MFEVRIHGRGGQGAVTAAELLAAAAFAEGHHAQAFPSFGSERTGAPVMAFCRIGDRPIRTREPVTHPDALIIQDPTLLHQVNVFEGVRPGALLLINSARGVADLGISELLSTLAPAAALTVPAAELAQRHLGRPVPSGALLGGFAALTGAVSLESVPAERTVTVAIGHGKRAARSIDAWLRGIPRQDSGKHPLAGYERLNTWYYSDAPASVRPRLETARRISTFDEVEGGLDAGTALFEARRCLSCGNCFECDNCYGVCPDNAVIKLGPGLRYQIDLDYCKGCGICAAECPCGAIDMRPEQI